MLPRLPAILVLLIPVCHAGILPLMNLDDSTLEAFQHYVHAYEDGPDAGFRESRTLLMDSQPEARRRALAAGNPVVEILKGDNVANGHIHHIYGAIHVPGITAAQVRGAMQNYSRYSEYYKPDVAQSSGEMMGGGTPSDECFRVELKLTQSTLWIDVAFDTVYQTRYLRFGDHAFETMSKSTSIREYKDAHNPALGTYLEGHDHGFLWGIDTWWHALDRGDGVDLEMTNMTLTRPVPFGFGWWASKKARTSVENLLLRTRSAVLAANQLTDPARR